MKILATGGTGYIGSHTVVELINLGYDVEILDNLYNSKESVLDRIKELTGVRPKLHKVDMTDAAKTRKVFENGRFDAVIHFAGLKAVGESVRIPLEYYRVNIGGAVNILDAMREFKVKKLIFSSSACVYGEPGVVKYTEDLPVGQKISSPYGETKYMVEQLMRNLSTAWDEFEATSLRYFNPVGAHPSGLLGEDPNGEPNNLMPIIMHVDMHRREKLEIFGNDYPTKDGTCIRDFIHVVDLAKGHAKALEYSKPGFHPYNLGTGFGISVQEMVDAFEETAGRKLPKKVVGRRAGDLPEYFADPSKAARDFGWRTELGLEDIMRDTLNFLNHERKKGHK